MDHCCGRLAVEIVPVKHCDFSTYLAKGAKAQCGACADVNLLIMEKSCGPLTVEMVSGKHCGFQHLSCQESESSVWSMRRGALS
jgi:hypothetical protein